jgi:hypothetical protein
MASPMRSYILQEKGRIKRLALFCTLGGAGGEAALSSMAELCGRGPIADLQVRDSELKSGAWRVAVDEFARRIREKAAKPNLHAVA